MEGLNTFQDTCPYCVDCNNITNITQRTFVIQAFNYITLKNMFGSGQNLR